MDRTFTIDLPNGGQATVALDITGRGIVIPCSGAEVDDGKMGLEEGERQTVEKIVAWLRGLTDWYPKYPRDIANAIEAGEWK